MRLVSRALPVLVVLACSSQSGSVPLATSLVFPQGLLDGVTKLTVNVYDTSGGALSYNAVNGTVNGLSGQKPLATKDLNSTGCASNAKFCGDISIDESNDPRLFTA